MSEIDAAEEDIKAKDDLIDQLGLTTLHLTFGDSTPLTVVCEHVPRIGEHIKYSDKTYKVVNIVHEVTILHGEAITISVPYLSLVVELKTTVP